MNVLTTCRVENTGFSCTTRMVIIPWIKVPESLHCPVSLAVFILELVTA